MFDSIAAAINTTKVAKGYDAPKGKQEAKDKPRDEVAAKRAAKKK